MARKRKQPAQPETARQPSPPDNSQINQIQQERGEGERDQSLSSVPVVDSESEVERKKELSAMEKICLAYMDIEREVSSRPCVMTEPVVAVILYRLRAGETLMSIYNDSSMPHRETIYRWMRDNKALKEAIMRAREEGSLSHADKCLEIADSPAVDKLEVTNKRYQIQVRQWLAEVFHPVQFGKQVKIEHKGQQSHEDRIKILEMEEQGGAFVAKDEGKDEENG